MEGSVTLLSLRKLFVAKPSLPCAGSARHGAVPREDDWMEALSESMFEGMCWGVSFHFIISCCYLGSMAF